MKIYLPSKEELEATIETAVEQVVNKHLPHLIREAARKEYLTIEETCELLNVSRRHLQYLRDTSQISFVQNGRKIYFKAEDLDEFFSENYINHKEED